MAETPNVNVLRTCSRFCSKLPVSLSMCSVCKHAIVTASFYAISDSCILCECCYIKTSNFADIFPQRTHFYHDVICDNCYYNSDGVTEFTQFQFSINCLVNLCDDCTDKISDWCYRYFRRYDRYNLFYHNGILVNYRPHPSISLQNIPTDIRSLITRELIQETIYVIWSRLERVSSSYILGSFREWCLIMNTISIKAKRSVLPEFSVKLLINLVSSKIACILEYDDLIHVSILPHDIPWIIDYDVPTILAQPVVLHKYLYKIIYLAQTNPYMLIYEPFYHIHLPEQHDDTMSVISLE